MPLAYVPGLSLFHRWNMFRFYIHADHTALHLLLDIPQAQGVVYLPPDYIFFSGVCLENVYPDKEGIVYNLPLVFQK